MEHIKDLKKAFGLRIRALRKKKGLSQEDLADILKIASALQVSPGQLFRFQGVRTNLNLDEQIVDQILVLAENLKPSTKRRILENLRSVMKDIKV
jgi:transcriptional regulator with XRE-family HTH domain